MDIDTRMEKNGIAYYYDNQRYNNFYNALSYAYGNKQENGRPIPSTISSSYYYPGFICYNFYKCPNANYGNKNYNNYNNYKNGWYNEGNYYKPTTIKKPTNNQIIINQGTTYSRGSIPKYTGPRNIMPYTMSFPQLIQDIYSITNAFRRCHGANPLQVSQNLVNSAQRYANILAQSQTGQLIHDPNNYDQGENLASSSPNIAYVGVRMWYDEYKLYNYNAGVFTKGTGHFTQLVWKNTQYMGCAAATSTRWNLVFIVCRYSPPGNYQGQFFENVGRQVCLVDY